MGTAIVLSRDGQIRLAKLREKLIVGASRVVIIDVPYKNISGSLETVAIGQVMGVVSTGGRF